MIERTTVFTVCNARNYSNAVLLSESLAPDVELKIGIVGGNGSEKNSVDVSLLNIEAWSLMVENYDETALLAAIKPFFAQYFLNQANTEQIIYFDPTTQVFGNITSILEELNTSDILLAPRLTRPFGKSEYADEKFFLNTGLIDAGFWAMKKTENTEKMLRWWQDRLTTKCHYDLANGQNHDQLWLMYATAMYESVKIVKHRGWNVGLQNLHERTITSKNGIWKVNGTEPLLFFNFKQCTTTVKSVQKYIVQAGAGILVEEYVSKLGIVNTLNEANNPLVIRALRWREQLRKKLEQAIHFIDTFPLYHAE